MATYFLNCSENIENFNLCISHNVAGFPNGGYKTGDLIYLIVKENGKWKLGARGNLLEATNSKPWKDAEKYSSAFNIKWETCAKTDITEGLKKLFPDPKQNYGLAIQGKKDIDNSLGEKGKEIKMFLNQFFINSNKVNNAITLNMKDLIIHVHKYITSLGFQYQFGEIANFYLALRAKPFVILAGISGTGKTKLPRKFAEALGFNEEEQLIQIPVRPDWTDSSDLLGYTSLDKTFIPKALTLAIKKASANPEKPYFFILDEMNLARVEHYFSDYLSVIETRKREFNSKTITTDKILRDEILNGATNASDFKNIGLPQNLYLIGTVNMDETTHAFSRKVLDRANSIEMNDVDLNWISSSGNTVEKLTDISNSSFVTPYISSAELKAADKESIKEEMQLLQSVNKILQKADLHFAYRVRDEIAFYLTINKAGNLIESRAAFDFQLVQKILPRIHGSSERVQKVLIELIYLIEKGETENVRADVEFEKIEKQFPINTLKYKRASKKILFMLKRFDEDRFTSFWL
jgi:energy-coupling factor transporter ATP-binding protein EcfA2